MPVTDSTVEIKVNVVDANSGEVIARIEKAFDGLGAAGAGTGAKAAKAMKDVATSSKQASTEVEQLAKEFSGGESSLRTMNAEIRSLQGSIFGDTRAMAEFLALSPKVGEAMELAFPLFGATAMVGVLIQAGEKVYELYEKWLSTGHAVDEYNEKAAKAAAQEFGRNSSLEDLNADLVRTNELVDQLNQKRQQSGVDRFGGGFTQWIPGWAREAFAGNGFGAAAALGSGYAPFTESNANDLNAAQGQSDRDKLRKLDLDHKAALQKIEGAKTIDDARLVGIAKVRAARAAADAEAKENHAYLVAREQQLAAVADRGKKPGDKDYLAVRADAGAEEEKLARQKAAAQAEAQRIALDRRGIEEIRQLRNEATNADLHGIALYEAQKKEAIEELQAKGIAGAEAVGAVNAKFAALEKKYLADELQQTQLIEQRAKAAGMHGIAKTQAEGDIRIATIRGSNLSDDAKAARVAAAQQETHAQVLEEQRQFSQQIDQIADESAQHQISGFARINAEETKQLDDLKKKFDAVYGGLDHASPEYRAGLAQEQRGEGAIRGGSDEQRQELARRNAEETQQIEDQARMRSLSAEKQKTAAIDEEYAQRLRKYQDHLQQKEISWDDYKRRVKAAGEERDAEMEEAAKQARQKMAGEFDSFFKGMEHPLQELQSLGAKVASQAAAEMVEKMQKGHAGGIFGGIFGHHAGAAHGAGAGLAAEMSGHASSGSGAAGRSFAISSAVIHVGAAQIGFAGGGFSAGSHSSPGSFGATGLSMPSGFGGGSFPSGGAGGAGSAGFASAAAHTGGGAMPGASSGPGVMGDLQQGMSAATLAKSLWGSSGSTNKNAVPFSAINGPNDPLGLNKGSAGATSSTGAEGWLKTKGMGAATGALGLFSAFEGNGGVGGALSGAMSGMKLGGELGGPIGAGIGAAAGAVMGAIGFGGREKARVYDLKQVRPRITADQDSYAQGGMDYLSAYSDMQSLDMEAKKATNKMGPAAQSYYQDTIKKELRAAEQKFTNEQKAGRSMYTATAAQFDIGADYIPRDGMAMIHQGERILPSDQNERITRAIESGGNVRPAASGAGGETHLHVHAIDAKSSIQFLMSNKHAVRAALNQSYAENSGGSDA